MCRTTPWRHPSSEACREHLSPCLLSLLGIKLGDQVVVHLCDDPLSGDDLLLLESLSVRLQGFVSVDFGELSRLNSSHGELEYSDDSPETAKAKRCKGKSRRASSSLYAYNEHMLPFSRPLI